ncbi:hypothetical protein BRC68_13205 [Halobacteriales archaeon QH_6_64_20]|nr:MAG: hypothetical protein BRC68_13205 [Halobacteriales archaeon QH_6_64_20]
MGRSVPFRSVSFPFSTVSSPYGLQHYDVLADEPMDSGQYSRTDSASIGSKRRTLSVTIEQFRLRAVPPRTVSVGDVLLDSATNQRVTGDFDG